ncbi:uncharacterized protein LOC142152106 [Mixophyes fleayi]|uniref:uncharacterized protein LOC142152106 n=1 Tax=Mixophyes fleayi TaxID=3061075 RepID=UPI003F4E16E5
MPRPRRNAPRPARLRSPSPPRSRRHLAPSPPSLPSSSFHPAITSSGAPLLAPLAGHPPAVTAARRGRATPSLLPAGSRMRRTRAPSRPAGSRHADSSAWLAAGSASGPVSDSSGQPQQWQAGTPPPPAGGYAPSPVRSRGQALDTLCPITPPEPAMRARYQEHNPPAPHQLSFPPSPFLPHSSGASAWGSNPGRDHQGPNMSQARTPPHGDHRHQLGGGTLPARHTRVFGDNTQAPVWPYFQRQRISPPASRLYTSHWASSPGYGAGGPYYGGQGGRSDNFVVDYHHSSGGNFGSGPPPLLGDSRLERRRESFSASPSTARGSAPNLSNEDRDSNTARRRLDYLPRHQITVPLSVSEPTVMHPETRVGSRDRPCAEAQDQTTAERREEVIQDTSGGQATAVSLGQTSVGDGNPAPAGDGVPAKVVWIIGHSFIFWAAGHPGSKVIPNHGSTVIRWWGKRGLGWPDIIPWLTRLIRQQGPPDVLVVHAGGNDLGKGKSLDLIIVIREDLRRIHEAWPDIIIGWSALIPRLAWRTTIPLKKMTVMVRKLNSAIRKVVRSLGGIVIDHPGLGVESPHLFRRDGVHLNEEGMRLFIDRICGGVAACFG